MSEDQGAKKGASDAAVKADAAVPAKPAALSDKDLEKVAGGANIIIRPNTNIIFSKAPAPSGFKP